MICLCSWQIFTTFHFRNFNNPIFSTFFIRFQRFPNNFHVFFPIFYFLDMIFSKVSWYFPILTIFLKFSYIIFSIFFRFDTMYRANIILMIIKIILKIILYNFFFLRWFNRCTACGSSAVFQLCILHASNKTIILLIPVKILVSNFYCGRSTSGTEKRLLEFDSFPVLHNTCIK